MIYGEGSLFKKIITWLSVLTILLPVAAYSGLEVAQAAQYEPNTSSDVDPSSSLKTPTRDPNKIVKISISEKDDVPIMSLNINATSNDVIKKGDKLEITFDKKNVDVKKIQRASNKVNDLYDVTKTNGKLIVNFKKDSTNANYQETFGVATKNVKANTKAYATFAGKSIDIKNNKIQSKVNTSQRESNNSQESNSNNEEKSNSDSEGDANRSATTQSAASSQSASQSQSTTSQSSSSPNPTFSEAENAVNDRTTIEVSGTSNVTSSNQTTNSETTTAPSTQSTTAAVSENNVTPEVQSSNAETTSIEGSDVDSNVNSDETTTSSTDNDATEPATTSSVTPTSTTQATNDGYIEFQSQGSSDPKATLDNYLSQGQTTTGSESTDVNESNQEFVQIYNHVNNKATGATSDEVAEIVKDMPTVWNYIGHNTLESDTEGQVWKFHTILDSGRDLFITIDTTANQASYNKLQKQMPQLARSFGRSIEPGALDQAMDIDTLKKSEIYQEYLEGKYPENSDSTSAADAINTVLNHSTISLDAPTNGASVVSLPSISAIDTDAMLQEAINNSNGSSTHGDAQVVNDNSSMQQFGAIQKDTYNKMTPWASEAEKQEMTKSIPTIWNYLSNSVDKNDTVGNYHNFVLRSSDGRDIYYTVDGRVIPDGNKFEQQFSSVLASLGKDMKAGDFDQAVNNSALQTSEAYQNYMNQAQTNSAASAVAAPVTAGSSLASAAAGLPFGIITKLLSAPLVLGGLLLAPLALGAMALITPVVAITAALAIPFVLPIITIVIPALLLAPIAIPLLLGALPLIIGAKLAFGVFDLINTFIFSTVVSVLLTAPIAIFNTVVGLGLALLNTLLGSIPLVLLDIVLPMVLNFAITAAISTFVQFLTFNALLFINVIKAVVNGIVDIALALSFIGFPLAVIKGLLDLVLLGLGLLNTLLFPLAAGALTFLLLSPIALLNTLGLTLFNVSLPFIGAFVVSTILSGLIALGTFALNLVLKVLLDLINGGIRLAITAIIAATILLGLPLLVLGGQALLFFALLLINGIGAVAIWGLINLAKTLMLLGLAIALFTLPLLGTFAVNTAIKWGIRALVHLTRFFIGMFKLGSRLVLSFVLGLLNLAAGLAKAASVISAVVSGVIAALTALIPVVGPVLALLPLIISLLSLANALILLPVKLVLGLLNLLSLGFLLLTLPLLLFVRPIISILLALGAGLISDIITGLLSVIPFLSGQLLLQGLITLPLLLLNLFNALLVEPLIINGLALALTLGTPLLLAIGGLGLIALLGLLLLSLRLPLLALAALALPSFIPFFNIFMDLLFVLPLILLVLSVLNLFIGLPLKLLLDTIVNLLIPFLVWLGSKLLLAPVFGPIALLNPLNWINLPLLSLVGTTLNQLILNAILLPLNLVVNGMLSFIPAALVSFLAGLLRALLGGVPFLLLSLGLLLPLVLNGFLTALVPGLNLVTVPVGLLAGLIGLPLVTLGLLNNLFTNILWSVASFVITYVTANILKDLLTLSLVPLLLLLGTPLFLFGNLLGAQFILFPLLWLGLPLLAQGLTFVTLWGLTLLKRGIEVALDIFNIGSTLLTLPLWSILPVINLLRRLAALTVALLLPIGILKAGFDLIKNVVELALGFILPLGLGLINFLLLLPLTTLNFLGLKFINVAIPLVLSLLATLALSFAIAGLTVLAMIAIQIFNRLLRIGAQLLLLGAIILLFLVALPVILGLAALNNLLLLGFNLFIGFNIWLALTLLNNLLVLGFLLGLFLLPVIGQLVINTAVKWGIRAVVHLVRFFIGLFRLGARLVLQFILGLASLVLGVATAASAIIGIVSALLAIPSLLVPVAGPFLFLFNVITALISLVNFLILLPLKLIASLLNALTLVGLLLEIPYWLFIRPLTSVLLALGAGVISDIVMTLLSLPLVLLNQFLLFNLIGIPAILLKAFNNLVLLPLLLAVSGLALALGLPFALMIGALGLLGLLGLQLLGLQFPVLALILLLLPNLIPFLDLILLALNLLGLATLLISGLGLLLLPVKLLLDLLNTFLLPLLVAGLSFLLLLPLLGLISILNPLSWLNNLIGAALVTLLAKVLFYLVALPLSILNNLLLSLIPAVLAGLLVGLLRALFGGLPFLLLALGLLLPLVLNGLLTALVPGLNLITVPLGLLAGLVGLPLVLLGLLNNLIKQLIWNVLGTIVSYLFLNLFFDIALLLLWPILMLLSTLPLFFINLLGNALLLRPLLLFGLPLLNQLLTFGALVLFNLIRRALEFGLELLNIAGTLLTLPLWTILPGINLLRKLLVGLVLLRIVRNILVGLIKAFLFLILPLINAFLGLPLAILAGIGTFLLGLLINLILSPIIGLVGTVLLLLLLPLILLPLNILGSLLLSIIPSLLVGLLTGLAKLLFGGLPFFLGLQLLFLIPMILLGLLTFLIPGVHLITVPLALLSLLIGLPLSILGALGSLLNSFIAGLVAKFISKLLLNLLGDLLDLLLLPLLLFVSLPLFLLTLPLLAIALPILLGLLALGLIILPIILFLLASIPFILLSMLLALPITLGLLLLAVLLIPFLFLFGLASLVIIWFLAPIILQVMVNPIADFEAFVISVYTMILNPFFYWVFWIIFIPLTVYSFVGMFVNWLNPLNILFHLLDAIGLVGMLVTFFGSFLAIEILKFGSLIGLLPIFGIPAFVALSLAVLNIIVTVGLYAFNAFLVGSMLVFTVLVTLLIAFIIVFLNALATLGINVPNIFTVWIMQIGFSATIVPLMLINMSVMLFVDFIITLIAIPLTALQLNLGLLFAFLAHPLLSIPFILVLALNAVIAVPVVVGGFFHLAHAWLPIVFGGFAFLQYLIFGNPIWGIAQWIGLVPIIGWIVQLITDWVYMPIGLWGPGFISSVMYMLWFGLAMPLILGTVFLLFSIQLALLPIALLVLIPALIGGVLLLLAISVPLILLALLVAIPTFVIGIAATAVLVWFLAPIVLVLLVNPIEDFKALIVMIYSMIQSPFFYWVFAVFTIPLTLLSFVGMFVNWLNPLFYIVNGVSIAAVIGLVAIVVLFPVIIGFFLINTALGTLGLRALTGIPAFFFVLTAFNIVLLILGGFILNAFLAGNAVVLYALLAFIVDFIIVFLNALATLGINVPNVFTVWAMLLIEPATAVILALLLLPIMILTDGLLVVLGFLPFVINMGLGLLFAFLTNPILTILLTLVLAVTSAASLVFFVLGLFMLAAVWLPIVFGAIPFTVFLIFENPIWAIAQWIGLVPIIGWIVQLIIDWPYMLFGLYGTGLLTAISYAIFVVIFVPLVFIVGTLGLYLLPLVLIFAIPAIIGGLLLVLAAFIPVIIGLLLIAIPVLVFGLASLGVIVWFLSPLILQLIVNPIENFKAFVVMVYTMILNPVFYWVFQVFTIPLTIYSGVAMFVNWFNPLFYIFNGIALAALIGLVGIVLTLTVAVGLMLINAVIATINALIGLAIWVFTSIAKTLLHIAIVAGLVIIPAIAQIGINLVIKWTVRIIVHILRFFVGLFRLGARFVLSFILGLNFVLVWGLRAINIAVNLFNLLLTGLSILVPVIGWFFTPIFGLITLLSFGIDLLLFLPSIIVLVVSGLDLLIWPFSLGYFFILRPINSIILALIAGVITDLITAVIGLIIYLINQVILFFLIGLPTFLLKLFSVWIIAPILINLSIFGLKGLAGILAFFNILTAFNTVVLVFLTLVFNAFLAGNAIVIYALIALVIDFIVVFLNALATLGINVPNVFTVWAMQVFEVAQAVLLALILLPLMITADFAVIMLGGFVVIPTTLIGLLTAFISTPILTLIHAVVIAAVGVSSLVMFILGLFMLAETWLPFVFGLIPFTVFLIFGNPIWAIAQWIGLVPIIGWIVQLIIDWPYMLFGLYGTGLLTAISYAIFVVLFVPLVFIVGAFALYLLPVVLIFAIPAILGGLLLILAAFIPAVIILGLLAIPALIFGAASLAVIIWFLGPVVLQIMVNPISDFVTFIVLVYTMFINPIFFWVFDIITVPLTIGSFIGMFVNWLNPLNLIFNALSIFALIGLVSLIVIGLVAVGLMLINAVIATINALIGLAIWVFTSIAKTLLHIAIVAGLVIIPAIAQIGINLVIKWTVRIIVHILRFFVGLFRLGARFVLSFILGLNFVLVWGLRAINIAVNLFNLLLTGLSILVPVIGWFFTPIFGLITLLSFGIDLLLFLPSIIVLVVSGLDLLIWPFSLGYFFILRPINSIILALIAGVITDLITAVIGLIIYLINQVILFFLIGLPTFLLKLFSVWIIAPILINLSIFGLKGLAGILAFFNILTAFNTIALVLGVFIINAFLASNAIIIFALIALVIDFIIVFLNALATLGINVPNVFTIWALQVLEVATGVTLALVLLPFMIVNDLIAVVLGGLITIPSVFFGILNALISTPILTIIQLVVLGTVAVSSIVFFLLGLFMLAQSWLPSVFGLLPFGLYLIFGNPVWQLAQWIGLVPIIGWIVQLITDWTYMPIGLWGPGFLAAISYTIFLTIAVPLVFIVGTIGLYLVIGLLPIALLLIIPSIVGLIAFAIAVSIPVLIGIALVVLPIIIIGIAAQALIIWFFAPIFTQILVNPISDLKTFIVMIYTMFITPLFYWLVWPITIPLTLFSFVGMFVNWLNPLNYLFKFISAFAILVGLFNAVIAMGLLVLTQVISPISLNFVAGWIAFFALQVAVVTIALEFIKIAFINPLLVTVPLILNVVIILIIAFIIVFLNAFATLGINVPNVFTIWVMIVAFVIQPLLLTLINMVIMMSISGVDLLLFGPVIAISLVIGFVNAILAHPLFGIINLLIAQLVGLGSVGNILSGFIMFAVEWLPNTFSFIPFINYLIFGNPIWQEAQLIGLVPIIGWIVQLITDWTYMPIGLWWSGMATAISYSIIGMGILWPLFVINIVGASFLLPIIPLLLIFPGALILPLLISIALGSQLLVAAIAAFSFLLFALPFLIIPLGTLLLGLTLLLPLLLLAFPILLLAIPLFLLGLPLLGGLLALPLLLFNRIVRGIINGIISLINQFVVSLVTFITGPLLWNLLKLLVLGGLLIGSLLLGLLNFIPLLNLLTIPLWLLAFLPLLALAAFTLLKSLLDLLSQLFWSLVTGLATFAILNLINLTISTLLLLGLMLLSALPLFLLLTFLAFVAFPITKLLLPWLVTGALIALGLINMIFGPLLGLPVILLDGLRLLADLGILLFLGLPHLIPFWNLLMAGLFLIPAILNGLSLFNLLRTPLKWIFDLFNQLLIPGLVFLGSLLLLIPFFGLISLLNPLKWINMGILSAIATLLAKIAATLFLLPLLLLNNLILSILPALLNGFILGLLRALLGGLPLDILGLLGLPLINLLSLLGLLIPGVNLIALPLLILTQLLGLPLLLDTLRNLIAPILWGLLASLVVYPIANLIKNILTLLGLPILSILLTLPVFLFNVLGNALALRPLLLFGLPLLAQGLTFLGLLPLHLLTTALQLINSLIGQALALLTLPIWLGLPLLNVIRIGLILLLLPLLLLHGFNNIIKLFGLPLLGFGLPLLAGLTTLLLGLPIITLLNMLLSLPILLALLLPLLAAGLLLPIKLLVDLILLPLLLLGNKLLGLPLALLAGLLLPLLLSGLFRHLFKLPFDLAKLIGLVLFNLLLPFIPGLNILTPILWPLGLLLLPLAIADVLRDIFGNLPIDLLNLLVLIPLVQLLTLLGLLIPGLGLLLAPILLPINLFATLVGLPLALIRTIGDIARLLLLGLPLALLGTILALPIINLINDLLSLFLTPLLSGLLTLPLFLINLVLLTLLTFPIAKGVLPFIIANVLGALVANALPLLLGLLLNGAVLLFNAIRNAIDLFNIIAQLLLLGFLILPGLIPFLDLFLDLQFLIPALLNGLAVIDLVLLPLKVLLDLLVNGLLPLLVALGLNLLLLPVFGPLQLFNPLNWIFVPLLSILGSLLFKALTLFVGVPALLLLHKLTSLVPAILASIVVPLLRSLLGGLPLDILGLLGLPLLNLLSLVGLLIPGVRLIALPLLILTQLALLPLLLDTLRNLIAPILWGLLAGLITYPIANLIKDALSLLLLPILGLLSFLPIFLGNLGLNVFVIAPLLFIALPLLGQALTFFLVLPITLLTTGLKLFNSLLPLALAILTMPLWFNLPLLNFIRRAAFWLLLVTDLLLLPFKLLKNLFRGLVETPFLLFGLPLLLGLGSFLLGLPLVTLAMTLLSLPIVLTLLLPLIAGLVNLPIKLLVDLLLLPLMLLGNLLLSLPIAFVLGNLIPLLLGALNGLIKLPFDLFGLLALPLLLGLGLLGKLFVLINPLLWPLLLVLNPLLWTIALLIPFKLIDILKDVLGPLANLPLDLLNLLLLGGLGILTLLNMLNPLFWPLLPVLLPLALALGLVAIPLALAKVLVDNLKLLIPLGLMLLLLPILNIGLDILGLLALPIISGLLTLPLFLLNLGLLTGLTLPIVKAILPIILNGLLLLAISNLPLLALGLLMILLDVINGIRLFNDAILSLLLLPGFLKVLLDLVLLPLLLIIKPLELILLPLLAKGLTDLLLLPLMTLNNFLAHLVLVPLGLLLGLLNALFPLVLLALPLNLLIRPLLTLGNLGLLKLVLPVVLTLFVGIPLLGLLALPVLNGFIALPLNLLSLLGLLFNALLIPLALGMITLGLLGGVLGTLLMLIGVIGLLGQSIPGMSGLNANGTKKPALILSPSFTNGGNGNNVIREIPSLGFWVHYDIMMVCCYTDLQGVHHSYCKYYFDYDEEGNVINYCDCVNLSEEGDRADLDNCNCYDSLTGDQVCGYKDNNGNFVECICNAAQRAVWNQQRFNKNTYAFN
ncbi:hypothetical protein [Lactobacillus terrae]|uniref:hypothetical protein n=1 Tax=Lactobacillus terrae TaxID=2269374 RepID=UPI000C1B7ADB|nr:hypothetical protein [Lactobacillus terrae]